MTKCIRLKPTVLTTLDLVRSPNCLTVTTVWLQYILITLNGRRADPVRRSVLISSPRFSHQASVSLAGCLAKAWCPNVTMSAGTNSGGSWTWPSAGGEHSCRWAPAVSWLAAQRWCWAPSLGGLGKGASSFEGASLGLKGGKDTALLIRERERDRQARGWAAGVERPPCGL